MELAEAIESAKSARVEPVAKLVELDPFENPEPGTSQIDLGMSNSEVSQARICWECPGSGIENYNTNSDESVVITNVPMMDVPPTRAGYIEDNPPNSDLDYLPDNYVIKQTNNQVCGSGAYFRTHDTNHEKNFAASFFKFGQEANSAVLANTTNKRPPQLEAMMKLA